MVRSLFVLVLALLVSSCGSSSPSSPSETPRVSGAWIGNSTLTSVSGGECVGSTLAAAIGSRDIFSARIQQTDNDLAASLTYEGNRTSCVYRGNTNNQSISLTMTSCPDGRIETFVCSNGDVRRLEIVDARVSVQNDNRTGRGTDTTTLNVYAAGSTDPAQHAHRDFTVSLEHARHPAQRLSHLRRIDPAWLRGRDGDHPGRVDAVLHEVRVVLSRSSVLSPQSSVSGA